MEWQEAVKEAEQIMRFYKAYDGDMGVIVELDILRALVEKATRAQID